MSWEEPRMPPAEVRGLVTQIAEELGPGWTVADDRHGNAGRMELHGHDGIELCIQVGPAQVAARGIHGNVGANLPHHYGCKQPVIRFSVTKPPRRMAGEITRRLLPTVREDAATLAAVQDERDAKLTGRLDTLLKARAILGGDLTWAEPGTSSRPTEFEYASNHRRYADTPHVVIELRDYKRNDHLDEVRVSNLTHDQVLVIVEAFARVITASRTA